VPLAETLKVTFWPAVTVALTGCRLKVGATGAGVAGCCLAAGALAAGVLAGCCVLAGAAPPEAARLEPEDGADKAAGWSEAASSESESINRAVLLVDFMVELEFVLQLGLEKYTG